MCNYDQVSLIPNKCIVESRKQCDTSVEFLGRTFKLPIIPANMPCVIDKNWAEYYSLNDYFYVMHRFGNTLNFTELANEECWKTVSISVGVSEDDKKLVESIKDRCLRVDYITIDVAHGFSPTVERMIAHIKQYLPTAKVIAGNIWGDVDSVNFLQHAGADALKVGLSRGAGCCTYSQTGVGSPMFTAALKSGIYSSIPVILDGGIRNPGQIAIAITGFLSKRQKAWCYITKIDVPLVMCGSLFAACSDSPAEITPSNKKLYYGSASAHNKILTGKGVEFVEGKEIELDIDIPIVSKLMEFKEALQSAISYAGGNDLTAFSEVGYVT